VVITRNPRTFTIDTGVFKLPLVDGTIGQVMITDGEQNLSFTTVVTGLANIVEDLTPQLGADLDMNTFDILASNANGPVLVDEAASTTNPTLIPRGTDLTSGIGSSAVGSISMVAGGAERMRWDSVRGTLFYNLEVISSNGPTILNETASATNPTLAPRDSDPATGIGSGASANLSLIVSSSEIFDLTTTTTTFRGTILEAANAAGPALLNEAVSTTNPTLLPDRGNPTSGIGADGSGELSFIVDGLEGLRIDAAGTVSLRQVGGNFIGSNTNGPSISNVASTATVPVLIPNRSASTTGVGGTVGEVDIIVSSVSKINVSTTGADVTVASATGITAFAGGGQGSATALTEVFNDVTTVVTAGDSVLAPAVTLGKQLWVFNADAVDAMDLFPTSGDDLGAGVDTAISVAAGTGVMFMGIDGTTWRQFI